MQAGTIVASNYLAMAQVLGDSFLEHHPDSTFSVLVVDDGPAELTGDLTVVRLSDLDLAPRDERLMRTIYDVMEFSTAVKPSFLRHLLAAGEGAACYLDPDIQVFSPFDQHVDAAIEYGIVLTPHVLQPVPRDGMRVDEETIMQSGMYNCGFLAVGPTAIPFLDWWDERLRFDALVDFGRARFTDQRWVDWVPSLFDFTIDRDPGMNVAWWNIHDRPIEIGPSGPFVAGGPVRFVHFSGYDPQQPELLSKHQLPRPRTEHAVGTGIRELADAYGALLVDGGHLQRKASSYPWNRSHDGVELTSDLRRLVRDAALDELDRFGEVRTVPDAFDPAVDFAAWVASRKSGVPVRPAMATTSSDPMAGVKVVRTIPEPESADVDDILDAPTLAAYDVEFDWDDAHGHAVRILIDHSEPGVVVDLGCGYAPHAEMLRDAGFEYVGLDLDPASLERLAARGFVTRPVDLGRPDQVEVAIADAVSELGSDADVVAVMALDVLEHLVEPEVLLATLWTWMRGHDRALLVTSVPNVAHRDIAAKLLAGRWDVTPTGLLDHTHLRFFTDVSITAVMASAGFVEAVRNDRIAPRSDQRWPAGDPITSPHTPLATLIGAIRDLVDEHGDTYQLIRAYRPFDADGPPTLVVSDASSPSYAVSVIADPGADKDDLARLRSQLEAQTSQDWELLAVSGPANSAADRVAAFDALLAAASGAYVALVERSEEIGPRWIEQFAAAMVTTVVGGAPDGDIGGLVLRCEPARLGADPGEWEPVDPDHHDPVDHPISALVAFPTAAVRALAADFDGADHQALRLLAKLAPLCGVLPTGIPAVLPGTRVAADTWTLDHDVEESRVATTLRAASVLPDIVDDLHDEVERLRAENERLAEHTQRLTRDNEWLNAELSPAPIKLVRRVLRRGGSVD